MGLEWVGCTVREGGPQSPTLRARSALQASLVPGTLACRLWANMGEI